MSKSSFTDCKTRANLEDAEVKVWRQNDNLQSFLFCDFFSENLDDTSCHFVSEFKTVFAPSLR